MRIMANSVSFSIAVGCHLVTHFMAFLVAIQQHFRQIYSFLLENVSSLDYLGSVSVFKKNHFNKYTEINIKFSVRKM